MNIFADIFNPVKKAYLHKDDYLNQSFYLEAKTFLHGLLVVEDKLSMAHSLETRVPFLDNDLVNFAMQVPNKFKVKRPFKSVNENDLLGKKKNLEGKLVLRKSLKKYLDERIINSKKQGFSSPDASWFKGESMEYINKNLLKKSAIFNQSIVKEIIDEHCSGKKNNRLAIWSLLYVDRFLNQNIRSN
mgnify:FL=1